MGGLNSALIGISFLALGAILTAVGTFVFVSISKGQSLPSEFEQP